MRHHRLAWVAAVSAMTALQFAPVTAQAAVPARALTPSDAVAPTVVKHVSTDVDGDGTRDSISLTYLGANQFTLTATTTKGTSASVTFTSVVDPDHGTAGSAWYGASAMDGRKGSELIVKRNTPDSILSGGPTALSVYTWRSGRLVAEAAPATPKGKVWVVNDDGSPARGYRFFSSHGHRYVDASWLKAVSNRTGWKGSVVRSVWRHGAWVKVSTRSTRTLTWGSWSIAGPRLLLGQVNVDVNGDSRPDLVSFYQNGIRHYVVKVATGKKTVEQGFAAEDAGFVGAAALDAVPGAELIVKTEWETPLWKVLTWRAGKLASLPGPNAHAGSAGVWAGAGDETVTNYTTSVEDGKHYVTETWKADESDIAHVKKWVWQANGWTTVSDWTQVTLTDDQVRAIHWRGFTAADLVTP